MNNLMWASWSGSDPLTIYFRGTGENFRKFIDNLVEDFEAPRENDELSLIGDDYYEREEDYK